MCRDESFRFNILAFVLNPFYQFWITGLLGDLFECLAIWVVGQSFELIATRDDDSIQSVLIFSREYFLGRMVEIWEAAQV
jgi:hypothetical protein